MTTKTIKRILLGMRDRYLTRRTELREHIEYDGSQKGELEHAKDEKEKEMCTKFIGELEEIILTDSL